MIRRCRPGDDCRRGGESLVKAPKIRRYEAGSAQPTLDALVKLAKALHVSLDELVFDEAERGPSEEFRLQFEAVSQLPEEDKKVVKALLDGMIVKNQAKRMVGSLSS